MSEVNPYEWPRSAADAAEVAAATTYGDYLGRPTTSSSEEVDQLATAELFREWRVQLRDFSENGPGVPWSWWQQRMEILLDTVDSQREAAAKAWDACVTDGYQQGLIPRDIQRDALRARNPYRAASIREGGEGE